MQMFLAHRRVAFLLAQHGVDELELCGPREAARAAGATTLLVAPSGGVVTTTVDGVLHRSHQVDRVIADVVVSEIDALVLPDGETNSLSLRQDSAATQLVRDFAAAQKPVGAFGFAVLSLMDAGILGGRDVTGSQAVRADVMRAGARWHDRRVVVDGNVITSRGAPDVAAFNTQLVAYLDR